MDIVVDTSVWSLVLSRRRIDENDPWVRTFRSCVDNDYGILLVGPVLQELLAGVRTARDFNRLLKILAPFPLAPLDRETFALAAQIHNRCRRRGAQASGVDFLIAAACIKNGLPLLTADADFTRIAERTQLVVMKPVA